jgi:3-oxoacyl-[acyl-carrier protein] reductase
MLTSIAGRSVVVTGASKGIGKGLSALGPDSVRSMAASVPPKRLGTVEDVGYAALFLASQEASYITGQTIIVDGGQILPETFDALGQA